MSNVFSNPLCLSPSGGGVSGGGGGRRSADVLDSFQAAIIYSDCVSMQVAETGENLILTPLIWYVCLMQSAEASVLRLSRIYKIKGCKRSEKETLYVFFSLRLCSGFLSYFSPHWAHRESWRKCRSWISLHKCVCHLMPFVWDSYRVSKKQILGTRNSSALRDTHWIWKQEYKSMNFKFCIQAKCKYDTLGLSQSPKGAMLFEQMRCSICTSWILLEVSWYQA